MIALTMVLALVFLAAAAGLVFPWRKGWKRWHFLLVTSGAFAGMLLTAPEPTPEERAARQAKEAEAKREEALTAHDKIVNKAALALQAPTNYTRAEYGKTYARVGGKTFARLNALEPGAAYAAAESESCDRVDLAMVSDMSKPGAAVWFADCANQNRFMIAQKDAEAALARFKAGKLAPRDLEASCTLTSIARCKLTPAQRNAKDKESEYVSACDLLLEHLVSDRSGLALYRWTYHFGKGERVIIERPFDSPNAAGVMQRSRYRCEVDASNNGLKAFSVSGAVGRHTII